MAAEPLNMSHMLPARRQVAHVAAHELGTAAVAVKAVRAAAPGRIGESAGRLECRWQREQLTDVIRESSQRNSDCTTRSAVRSSTVDGRDGLSALPNKLEASDSPECRPRPPFAGRRVVVRTSKSAAGTVTGGRSRVSLGGCSVAPKLGHRVAAVVHHPKVRAVKGDAEGAAEPVGPARKGDAPGAQRHEDARDGGACCACRSLGSLDALDALGSLDALWPDRIPADGLEARRTGVRTCRDIRQRPPCAGRRGTSSRTYQTQRPKPRDLPRRLGWIAIRRPSSLDACEST